MPNATTASLNAASNLNQPSPALRHELRRRLLALPYRAFLQVIIHLLHSQGCTAARPAGRDLWKGRNTAGGWDAEADFEAGGLGTLRCIAQVKHFDTLVVAQRQVDELRGTCLRACASQALLITLSTFSPPARLAAQSGGPVAPVRLIDGNELLGLLADSRLGVKRDRSGEWRLDKDYFAELMARLPQKQTAASPKPQQRERSLRITLRLDPPNGISRAGEWHWEADLSAPQNLDGKPF